MKDEIGVGFVGGVEQVPNLTGGDFRERKHGEAVTAKLKARVLKVGENERETEIRG